MFKKSKAAVKTINIIALIWNILGLMAFIMHLSMSPEMISQLPPEQQALYTNVPDWLEIAFGAAVIGGTLGCIALLIGNAFAVPLFIISLIGVLAQNYHSFFMSNTFEVMGNSAMVMPILVILIAIYLVVYSLKLRKEEHIK
ncbi:hypothetical protein [Aliikangiella sp. IMCC44632]